MPALTRWFIKASLVHLTVALAIAVAQAAGGAVDVPSWVWALRPVYFHLFMFGWVTQLIFGVAYWMFPKFSSAEQRGHVAWPLAVFVLLNLGLALRAVAEPAQTLRPAPVWSALLIASAISQMGAGGAFVLHIWGRVKER